MPKFPPGISHGPQNQPAEPHTHHYLCDSTVPGEGEKSKVSGQNSG